MQPRIVLPIVAALLLLNPTVLRAAAPGSFPTQGIMPKAEIGALRFLEAHPQYDGRGVVVAIFDTGVDPGAAGLQTTTDGKPKIVDLIDGSGSGDVDTATVVKATNGVIKGLSGRELKVNPAWQPRNNEYRVGLKRGYELYPGALVNRVKAERRKDWDEAQRALMTREERRLTDFDAKFPKPAAAQKKVRADLEERVKQLKALAGAYDDPGPIYDCVVFHDGKVWRAVIDTDEDGDLKDEQALTNFKAERQHATFGKVDLLNFAVNIYGNGSVLSIVADCGAHGTHVAGIVAGHFPDQPELNGIAPGAQIVSVKIGDSRMGSSSMGTGETRGIISVLQNKCDLINMSYGGDTLDPNRDRHARLYTELVNRHGVIFVSSAGNNGPALSTVGSPGGTTSALIGVGAYVSPEMMTAQYSLREAVAGMNFTWSSRGPTFDGDLGVDICAPGAAIAPVSNWTLQRNMLMNGTSMSSPNACGGIALLLSACKAEKIPHTPARIKRALQNTAEPVENVFAQGRGMLQVDKAWEYLQQHRRFPDQDLVFDVRVTDRDNARGIYLREAFEFDQPTEATVTVTPQFHEEADNRGKVAFELRLNLACEADWVSLPGHLMMMHGGRYFRVKLDASKLEPGVHYTEITGVDAASPERGPVFRVPVTVIKPQIVDRGKAAAWSGKLTFQPGEIHRRFLAVPEGAEWADLRMVTRGQEPGRRLVVHTVQKVPGHSYSQRQSERYYTFKDEDEQVHSFAVTGGRTVELCLAQYWSSLGGSEYDFELTFHGIAPDDRRVHLDGADLATRIEFAAVLENADLAPAASLNVWRQTMTPTDFAIRPLDPVRDRLPRERQILEGVLTYSFNLEEKGKVKPVYGLNDEWESSLWTIYDSHKRPLAHGSSGKEVTLDKGGHVLRLHVRQDRRELLEKIKDLPVHLDIPLAKPVSLAAHATYLEALTGGRKLEALSLTRGERSCLYLLSPSASQLPKGAKAGDSLHGTITFGKVEPGRHGAGRKPGGFPLSLRVPPSAAVKKPAAPVADAKPDGKKSEVEKLKEEIRDLKVNRLAKLYGKAHAKDFQQLAEDVLKEWPNYLPVRIHQLKRADQDANRKSDPGAVIAAADAVIARLDTGKLRDHYGVFLDFEDEKAAAVRKEMDKDREILTDALLRKARAIVEADRLIAEARARERAAGKQAKSDPGAKPAAKDGKAAKGAPVAKAPAEPALPKLEPRAFENTQAELRKWLDAADDKTQQLQLLRDRRERRFGEALKLVQARVTKSPADRKLLEERIELLESLGWKRWAEHERRWNLLRFPKDYQPF